MVLKIKMIENQWVVSTKVPTIILRFLLVGNKLLRIQSLQSYLKYCTIHLCLMMIIMTISIEFSSEKTVRKNRLIQILSYKTKTKI